MEGGTLNLPNSDLRYSESSFLSAATRLSNAVLPWAIFWITADEPPVRPALTVSLALAMESLSAVAASLAAAAASSTVPCCVLACAARPATVLAVAAWDSMFSLAALSMLPTLILRNLLRKNLVCGQE